MLKDKPSQPQLGAWNKMPIEEVDRSPKVEFQVNIPVTVKFMSDEPREYQGDTGAYYVFDVEENGTKKVVMTSAWSLLRQLKILTPLTSKNVIITKKIDKGKQYFTAEVK